MLIYIFTLEWCCCQQYLCGQLCKNGNYISVTSEYMQKFSHVFSLIDQYLLLCFLIIMIHLLSSSVFILFMHDLPFRSLLSLTPYLPFSISISQLLHIIRRNCSSDCCCSKCIFAFVKHFIIHQNSPQKLSICCKIKKQTPPQDCTNTCYLPQHMSLQRTRLTTNACKFPDP